MSDQQLKLERLRRNLERLVPGITPSEAADEAMLLLDVAESAVAVRRDIMRLMRTVRAQEAEDALIQLVIQFDLARSRLSNSYPPLQRAMGKLTGEEWDPFISPDGKGNGHDLE